MLSGVAAQGERDHQFYGGVISVLSVYGVV